MEDQDTQDPQDAETQAPDLETMAIPETYKENATINKYKTVGEVFKGLENANKLIGAKGVIIPKPDASPEEKEKYYQAIGKPVKPEDYKISEVTLHPSIKAKYDEKAQAVFKSMAHSLNLTQEQADGLHKWYFEAASKGEADKEAATDKAIKDGETALRSEWKADYDKKIAAVQMVVKKFGGPEVINALGDVGSHPAVVKMLSKLAEHFSEDEITHLGEMGTPTTINSARAKIKAIKADKTHPYWKGDAEAIKEVSKLYAEAYPNEEAA